MKLRHILVTILIITSTFGLGLGTLSFNSQAAGDSDGTLVIDTKVVASGTYDKVRVKSTGHLIIETSLEAAQLFLEAGSIIELTGGELRIIDSDTPGAPVFIKGTCDTFKMTNGAKIIITGSPGASTLSQSSGGNADLNVTVTNIIIIDNSEIDITAGAGYTKTTPGAATDLPLVDYQYSGGNASLVFQLSNLAEHQFSNSNISITGGSGGKASDGEISVMLEPGEGGGYSNGALVGGFVGSGGRAEVKINYENSLIFDGMDISVTGGAGGESGKGNISGSDHGGGGGGYSGGDGGLSSTFEPSKVHGKPGGPVTGYVGAGGNATLEVSSNSEVTLEGCSIKVLGGSGGDAAFQSDEPGLLGGMGGSGYGGGGGGAGYGGVSTTLTSYGGSGGDISGYVGSGGGAVLALDSQDHLIVKDTLINLSGGSGGSAGMGTPGAVHGGGGGGGYGGGGGGGGSFQSTGNISSFGGTGGDVSGNVGTGGDSKLKFNCQKEIELQATTIYCYGGSGGSAGAGGIASKDGGSGGGGFGGGGGGGKNGLYIGGTGGSGGGISGNVSSGGSANFEFSTSSVFDMMDSKLIGCGGSGGSKGVAGKYSSNLGGAGGGGFGGGGGGGGSVSYWGGPGGPGSTISGDVVTGGDINFMFSAAQFTISQSSLIDTTVGIGGTSLGDPGASGGLRINGYGAGGGGSGHIGNIGVLTLNIPMGIPRLISLQDNEVISNNLPTFEWIPQYNTSSKGVLTAHRLEISEKPDFTTPAVIAYTKDGTYQLKNPLKDGEYYWRVRAEYGVNNAGWSETRRFIIDTTPAYYSNLAPTGWLNTLSPNCTVDIGDSLTAIELESIEYAISKTDTMPSSFSDWKKAEGSADLNGQLSQVRAWAHPTFLPGTTNFIKWRAVDIVGNGLSESPVLCVLIDMESPLVNSISPENGSWHHDTKPIFQWAGFDIGSGLSGNCTFSLERYEGDSELVTVDQFSGPVQFNSSGVFSLTPQFELAYGKYQWQVKVQDSAGLWSDYTEPDTFHIDDVKPLATGLAPAGGEWVSTTPFFLWNAVDTFAGISDKFVLEAARDNDFQSVVYHFEGTGSDIIEQSENTYLYTWPSDEPLEEGTWFWRVSVMGNEWLWSDFSSPLEFIVDDTPPYVVPMLPLNGSWTNTAPELSWSAEDSGSGLSGIYRIQISEGREFVKPLLDEIVELDPGEQGQSSREGADSEVILTYKIEANLYKYVYYWRVFALDAVGIWSAPSDIYEFKIDTKPPRVMANLPGPHSWVGNELTFSWSAEDTLSGLSGEYNLQVSTLEDFQDALLDITFSGPDENNVNVEYTPTQSLPEGELFWHVRAKDKAGNWGAFTLTRSFQLDLSGVSFTAITQEQWFSTENVSFEIDLSDHGSGVNIDNIYYRTSTTGIATYGPWQLLPQLAIEKHGNEHVRCLVSVQCKEGLGNYIQFKARDNVNSVYQESPNYRISVDTSPVIFSEPKPSSELWQESQVVTCSVTIFDLYSGVDINTLEFRYSTSIEDEPGEWLPFNNSYFIQPSGEYVVKVQLALKEGEGNFIQWRVKDNAGNGYFISDEYQIKVRRISEVDRSEQFKPDVEEGESDYWDWSIKADLIFMLRLVSILIVFIALIALLRRQRFSPYRAAKLKSSRKMKWFGNRSTSSSSGEDNLKDYDGSSSLSGSNNPAKGSQDDGSDLEEIIAALEDELKDKFSTKSPSSGSGRGSQNPGAGIALPSSLKHNRRKGKIKTRSTPLTKPGSHLKNAHSKRQVDKKINDRFPKNGLCGICLGSFKSQGEYNTCGCGGRYHQSCSKRELLCPNCGKKL
ncbi:MAG: E3 ubiquitin protein ligase [Thermoplasmata archaeon]|nr:MAG: E3 ubiquitin protein ligase [Thermoplasmata archaeon]